MRGVIFKARALPGAVIPAKAGIHAENNSQFAAHGLDPRLRGNDRLRTSFEGDPFRNDTATQNHSDLPIAPCENIGGDSL